MRQIYAIIISGLLVYACKESSNNPSVKPASPATKPAKAGSPTTPAGSPATPAGSPASPAGSVNVPADTPGTTPGAKYSRQGQKFNGACLTYFNGQPALCVEDWFESFNGPCAETSTTLAANSNENTTGRAIALSQQWVNACPTTGILFGCLGKNSRSDTWFSQNRWFYTGYSQAVGIQPVCTSDEQRAAYP